MLILIIKVPHLLHCIYYILFPDQTLFLVKLEEAKLFLSWIKVNSKWSWIVNFGCNTLHKILWYFQTQWSEAESFFNWSWNVFNFDLCGSVVVCFFFPGRACVSNFFFLVFDSTVCLILLFSQYLSKVNVPMIAYKEKKWKVFQYPLFKLFSVSYQNDQALLSSFVCKSCKGIIRINIWNWSQFLILFFLLGASSFVRKHYCCNRDHAVLHLNTIIGYLSKHNCFSLDSQQDKKKM